MDYQNYDQTNYNFCYNTQVGCKNHNQTNYTTNKSSWLSECLHPGIQVSKLEGFLHEYSLFSPVCGEDGVTYSNQCAKEVEECKTNRKIKILHSGECRTETPCLRTEFRCKTDRSCVSYLSRCDGRPDCRDGSDEVGCEADCSSTQFRCSDGRCLPFIERCDGTQHCSDDEEDCPASCDGDQFRCNDGSCISLSLRCDRVSHCHDKTDEIGCPREPAVLENRTSSLICPPGQFECRDGRLCVEDRLLCDGREDCEDGSDEQDCKAEPCPEDHLNCGDGSCVDSRQVVSDRSQSGLIIH